MNPRTYRWVRAASGITAALAVATICWPPAFAAPASSRVNLGQLRPGFAFRIPYGKVSTISGASAVAQHDPAMLRDNGLLRDPRIVKTVTTPATLPPAIQFLTLQRPGNPLVMVPEGGNAFCSTFSPVNPQPLTVQQAV